jgi:hypothetical protein
VALARLAHKVLLRTPPVLACADGSQIVVMVRGLLAGRLQCHVLLSLLITYYPGRQTIQTIQTIQTTPTQ